MAENRPARMVDLPTSVHGFCYHDNDGECYIILNSRDSCVQNRKTYRHEMEHIRRGELFDPEFIEY